MKVETLGDLLDVAAEANPDGTAVRCDDASTSWAEAHYRAGQLRAMLAKNGIRHGDRVGVHYRKSADAFLAMHAVVGLGAVAVPLDPSASVDYLDSVVDRTGCRAVLTHQPCQRSAEALSDRSSIPAIADLDDISPLGPDPGLDPDDAAYIITTSGSTGQPKGICHTHASALAYVRFKLAAYDFVPADRISDLAPYHFDISTQALWVTPFVGATNVVVPEAYQMLPASLSQLMADEALTVWYGVPYLLRQLLSRGDLDNRDLSALRWVQFGGEVLPPLMLGELMERLESARFSNVYGPAEVNACTVHHLDGPPAADDPVPIGRPVADTKVRLVDPDTIDPDREPGEPAAGEQGEIWVSGPTMMVGYWGQPELDARSIVTWRGRRWYRTGDVGTQRPDGNLVFQGRIDHQVKVRGYRIELESIEAVLEDVDGVASAIATVIRLDDGSDVIVAGIVAEPGATADEDQIDQAAHEYLPLYAVPKRLYSVSSLPVTGSGKLDRRAIRSMLQNHHEGSND